MIIFVDTNIIIDYMRDSKIKNFIDLSNNNIFTLKQ